MTAVLPQYVMIFMGDNYEINKLALFKVERSAISIYKTLVNEHYKKLVDGD